MLASLCTDWSIDKWPEWRKNRHCYVVLLLDDKHIRFAAQNRFVLTLRRYHHFPIVHTRWWKGCYHFWKNDVSTNVLTSRFCACKWCNCRLTVMDDEKHGRKFTQLFSRQKHVEIRLHLWKTMFLNWIHWSSQSLKWLNSFISYYGRKGRPFQQATTQKQIISKFLLPVYHNYCHSWFSTTFCKYSLYRAWCSEKEFKPVLEKDA